VREVTTSVRSAAGELRAVVHYPDIAGSLPGLVLVDGAGDSAADEWGEQPATFGGCGAVVLTHDKPGCGRSPGDWRDQTLADRANDTLAALEVLRNQPGVDQGRVGLLGISQGGWVSYLAASLAPQAVRHLVVISGPGMSGIEQERYRIGRAVNGDPEALAWVDERGRRLLSGEDPAAISARQLGYAGRPWYDQACAYYGPDMLPFYARIAGFDPADVFPDVRCPVFAAFGGADTSVPVGRSVAVLSELLPGDPRHALAVFPGADHGLMPAAWDKTVPYAAQLAPGFLAMLTGWLAIQ
jgi:pimeloyl-ACP methyl ester carboxylesterase